ncbi:hypothetical protein OL239_10665 [Arthrobacter sp. ATA002]|uniref:hypothetical protein n=1 Tax=Arthrobacter sp. ATA002 TaxID=2991715 RepID=UPI0022A6DCB1|nr:hypothetical protein [Arthrobacter sp. ATA002]WAP50514.1 hypothetical protein OL239_10665 [Arthrobacter sp. ATA002]
MDLEDSAEALERLLTDRETYDSAGRGNGILEFTGPESVAFGDVADLLSRPARHVRDYVARTASAGSWDTAAQPGEFGKLG